MADETDCPQPTFTTREVAFCLHYTAIGTDTWHNGRQSAKAAGYSLKALDSNAAAVLRKDKIKRRLAELESKQLPPGAPPDQPQDREQMFAELWRAYNTTDNESVKASLLNQMRDEVGKAPDEAEIKALTAAEQATSERIALYLVTHDSNGELSICPHCHRPLTEKPAPEQAENRAETGPELRPEGAGGPQ